MKNESRINLKNYLFDFIAGIVIVLLLYPIAKWFYQADPPMGVDFYQFPSYIRYLTDHFAIPPSSWKFIWFDGVPLITDYSCLFFYLAIPITKIWGLVFGSKILLKELSNNRFFALAATTGLVWTTNYYVPLTGGGNVTYAATQLFVTLTLWLAIKYFYTNKKVYFSMLAFFAGLSFWGHAGTALIFVWVPMLSFLAFRWDEGKKFLNTQKIKDLFSYVIFSMAVGFLPLYGIAYLVLTIPKAADFNLFQEGGIRHMDAIKGLFLTQNFFLVIGAVILFILALVMIKPGYGRKFFSFLSLAIYFVIFQWLYLLGRNPFAGGIMPPRTFWFLPLIIIGLAALCWDVVFNKEEKMPKILAIFIVIILFLSPLCPLFDLNKLVFKENLAFVGVETNFREYMWVQSTLTSRILGNSSLEAQKINVDDILTQKNLKSADFESLKGIILPQWLPFDDLKYRLHTLEVGVNIWWSIPFNLPITHGSYNSAHLESNNYAYWTDMAFHGELTTRWNHPFEIAKNDLLFLIDWRGIRYLLGNEVEVEDGTKYSIGESVADPSSIVTFLTQNPEFVDRRGLKDIPSDGKTEISKTGFDFFRINEKITSPIVKTTNAPTILVIGEPKTAHDNLLRNLGHLNLNSRFVIPIKGGLSLDNLSLSELKKFDLIWLQYYQSSAKTWNVLNQYVQEGGKVFVETGGEVKESEAKNLPAIFPVSQTARESLGKNWNLTPTTEDPLTAEVNEVNFGPLLYNDQPWKISHSEESFVRPWAKTILAQNKKPFLVAGNLGKGRVIWSGLNLSYHFNQYMSLDEGKLIKNIIASMIPLEDEKILNYAFERPTAEKILVSGSNFKGVLLKENNYGGWTAQLTSPSKKNLTVYNVGLGYVYVQLPENISGQVKVKIEYKGTAFIWFFFFLAIASSVWLFYEAIFTKEKTTETQNGNISDKIKGHLNAKVTKWWQSDDEQ